MRRVLIFLCLTVALVAPASAHPAPFSYVDVRLDGANVELTVSGPFMVGLRRTFPRTALNRLYALCQTAAEL